MDTAATPDRAAIRAEIEAMSPEFATLVGAIGDERWKTKSGIPAYTCGQLAWHVASAAGFLAGETAKAKDGKALNPPAFLRPVLYKLGEWRVRVASRKATPASVLADFDSGARKLLAVLESFDDETLRLSATRMGETLTIAALFHKPVEHLAEHAAQIRAGLQDA
ncbi:MAG: maleylpyruvate isomerase N-terminal domain-containing protein [Dehalococcoidia bacterium]